MNAGTHPPAPWNASQRAVLVALLAVLLVYLGVRLFLNSNYVSDPQPIHPVHELDLQDKIDPNTADVKALAALPTIGEKRAKDIVAYRERFALQHPGVPAYKRLEDLLRIRGIGQAMLNALEPYLIFPSRADPTTMPH